MHLILSIVNLLFLVNFGLCRDYYAGMFRNNDYLVAQDTLYKEKRPFSYVQAEYGRLFKCPITYIRVVDRLGMPGPTIKVVRGGLQKRYISIRMISGYNLPISVNVYVGCENKEPPKALTRRPQSTTTKDKKEDDDKGNSTQTTAAGDQASGTGQTNQPDKTDAPDQTTPKT